MCSLLPKTIRGCTEFLKVVGKENRGGLGRAPRWQNVSLYTCGTYQCLVQNLFPFPLATTQLIGDYFYKRLKVGGGMPLFLYLFVKGSLTRDFLVLVFS
jgi:hypothetical protein